MGSLYGKESIVKFLLTLLILLSFYTNAKTEIIEDFEFYTVSTTSKSNLLKNLNSSSPIRQDGHVFHGYTRYDIKWRFWWKSINNQCVFTRVETNLKLKYTMPSLNTSNLDVKAVWSKWYPNLELHEKGHGKLAKDIAYKIDEKLISIGPKANCKILNDAGNKLGHKLMATLNESNKAYDKKTNHGESQQAWLYMHL